jgi:serine/threonine-protein kinase
MLGSPLYMAPEQMRSAKDVDARADVWALGVVLFELLTRRWPFEAENLPELCLKVVTEPPQSLVRLRPDAPPGLAAVIERCLQKDPAVRYANAAELAAALEPFGAQQVPRRTPSAASIVLSDEALRSASMPTLASNGTPREASTPAAWDSASNRASPNGPQSRARWLAWTSGGVILVAALAIGILSRRTSKGQGASESALASGAAAESAPAPAPASAPIPVFAPVPAPTPAAAPVPAFADAGSLRTLIPLPAASRVPARVPTPERRAKPEDDIPALR